MISLFVAQTNPQAMIASPFQRLKYDNAQQHGRETDLCKSALLSLRIVDFS